MTTKMNPAVKEKWVAALRSGEYRQTTGVLRDSQGHCCLGVLCEIAATEGVLPGPYLENGRWVYGNGDTAEVSVLPTPVMDWADLRHNSPSLSDHRILAVLNDNNTPFTEIADLIEEHL